MNDKFLRYYNKELAYLRNDSLYFAQEYPKIAARLGMNSIDVADPYVERLLEGIAFLNARTNLKIDAAYPKFVTNILEVVYPQLLNPTPAAAIIEFQITDTHPLNSINVIKRGETLKSLPINHNDQKINCTFSFTQELSLSPLKLESVSYLSKKSIDSNNISGLGGKSVLRLNFSMATPFLCSELIPEKLKLFLGHDIVPASNLLYLLISQCNQVICHNYEGANQWSYEIKHKPQHIGFDDNESLSVDLDKSVASLRIIQDYVQLPEKFLFVEQMGIKDAIAYAEKNNFIEHSADQVQKVINDNGVNKQIIDYQKRWFSVSFVFDELNQDLLAIPINNLISISAIPIVNVFKKRGLRFSVDANTKEHHIVADKTQPLNFEIHTIEKVISYNSHNQKLISYRPIYQYSHEKNLNNSDGYSYFSLTRERRLAHDKIYRTSYLGHEVFVSLSETLGNEEVESVHQISVDAWCTNRDLTIMMPTGADFDFLIDRPLPVRSIKLIKKLTRPREAIDDKNHLWPILNLFRLNHSFLLTTDNYDGAQYLKNILSSFPHEPDDLLAQNIHAIIDVSSHSVKKVVREGVHCGITRGIRVIVVVDEGLMGGVHPFLFGSVLRHYLSCTISVNNYLDFSINLLRSNKSISWSNTTGTGFFL